MKVMRSTREGSVCADCGGAIKIGDPIAYFGPRNVYGLTCHRNDKTEKHLRKLLQEEGSQNGSAPELEVTERGTTALKKINTEDPRPSEAQEWVCKVSWDEAVLGDGQLLNALRWLLKARYCGQLGTQLNTLEFRAPRNVGVVGSKFWAESVAKELCPFGSVEVVPLWVE
jgi:hypothetical protein